MDESVKRTVVDKVVRKCKLYLSPFFVYNVVQASKSASPSKSGYFVFLQSPDTIIMHGMPGQGRRDHLGPTRVERGGSRQVMLKFMKYEDVKELVRDDFEVSGGWSEAIAAHNISHFTNFRSSPHSSPHSSLSSCPSCLRQSTLPCLRKPSPCSSGSDAGLLGYAPPRLPLDGLPARGSDGRVTMKSCSTLMTYKMKNHIDRQNTNYITNHRI